MKLLRIALIALLTTFTATVARAEFRYGPLLGASFTDFKFKQDLTDVKMQVGGHAGLQCEMIFPGIGLGIDFGLLYYMNGAKVNLGQCPIWQGAPQLGLKGFGNERVLLHNVQIPVHLRWKWTKMSGVEDYIAPIVYVGPDFNIQAGHSPVKAGGRKAFRFSGGDVGITLGAGMELWKHTQVTFGYTWGVTSVCRTRLLDDYSAKCSGWQVRVAYLF